MRLTTIAVTLTLAVPQLAGQTPQRTAIVIISVDGMRPDYVSDAAEHGLKIPTLRRIFEEGAHATGVRGVAPTVTYPSHTTLMTGVSPARHGIAANGIFDPTGREREAWYWYSEDIRVPTLWEAAAQAGYVTGSVSWPVTAGARGIAWLVPEYWRAQMPEDIKLVRLISTPGLMAELEANEGPYVIDLASAIPGDVSRTRYAEAIIRRKHADFMLVHLAALDHLEHESGPFSAQANQALEQMDGMVEALDRAIHEGGRRAAICIVSDHGFAAIHHQVNLRAAFVKAGLITVTGGASPAVKDWVASPWLSGGMGFVVLKDRNDGVAREAVAKLLQGLAADPANGIERVYTRAEVAAMGGPATAEFGVDLKPGFVFGGSGNELLQTTEGGTHGYAPIHKEMLASFLIAGPGIAKRDLGEIDMRAVAPTLARYLGLRFTTAEAAPLNLR